MPNRGLVLGIRLSDRVLPVEAAGSEGDPQWHAGDDPSVEEACVSGGCTNVSNRATAQ
jgi:hypothetical protein